MKQLVRIRKKRAMDAVFSSLSPFTVQDPSPENCHPQWVGFPINIKIIPQGTVRDWCPRKFQIL